MKRFPLVLLVLGSIAVLVNACSSSSEEAAPSRPPHQTTPAPAEAGTSEDAAPPDPSCLGDAGCYLCEPKQLPDFLNACTDGECIPFDNSARLPLYKAGEALPPVP
ncbi:hypothetical protein AKJ09_08143 [Labilithrix luteola]|uniref:Lipoprotein n=1 Tax=Labilithrix luteola TaxID=1391654 RepID=A0A0K1Q7U1_9BACT|nr:hypothetical protein [Labilithrix luteola]AKV01480.1 hypothetical protein AKJ09_08143 [Labilithrix luteola]